MKLAQFQFAVVVVGLTTAQTLNIPARVGEVTPLPTPSIITGSEDQGSKEVGRGQPWDSDEDTDSDNAVHILEDGASPFQCHNRCRCSCEGVHRPGNLNTS